MSVLLIVALALLLLILGLLAVWARRKQRGFNTVLQSTQEAVLLGELVEEQKKLNARLDRLADELARHNDRDEKTKGSDR